MINAKSSLKSGFTIVEMSMVLVIIGLIIGSIVTGQELINAAYTRAQISQIEKYNVAVHTFQLKYGYLPGDIPDPTASIFGFQARGAYAGEGDGNGILEGNSSNTASGDVAPSGGGAASVSGELATFWVDLTTASLIDAGIVYLGVGCPAPTSNFFGGSCPTVQSWIPPAKLGNGSFVSVFSLNGTNYFSLSFVSGFSSGIGISGASTGVTVQQAYNIDHKIDDGLPQSGRVTACYSFNGGYAWAIQHGWGQGAGGANCVPVTTATPYQNYNCYDNNNVAGTQTYSLKNANISNCALSFRFQ